jgi:hypothetical protein
MQKIKTGNNSEPNKVLLQSSLLPRNDGGQKRSTAVTPKKSKFTTTAQR